MLKTIRNNLLVSDEKSCKELLELALSRSDFEISYTEAGKPYLRDGGVEFSFSDCDGVNVCAVSYDGVIGVDIQKRCDKPRVREEFFSEAEKKLPFAKVWARKEAYAKWLGTGLSRETLRVDTTELDFDEYEVECYYIAVYRG